MTNLDSKKSACTAALLAMTFASTAAFATSASDAQSQARSLLIGNLTSVSEHPCGASAKVEHVDVQAQARGVLLGSPSKVLMRSVATADSFTRTSDAQSQARSVLLGNVNILGASLRTSTFTVVSKGATTAWAVDTGK